MEEAGTVIIRGIYDLSGMRDSADFMIWWHAEEFEDIQKVFSEFRRTTVLGQISDVTWIGNSLHRPAEFNKSHLPSFIMGEEPEEWIAVYPFVRSFDWYLLEDEKRRKILMEHGMAARDYQMCALTLFQLLHSVTLSGSWHSKRQSSTASWI